MTLTVKMTMTRSATALLLALNLSLCGLGAVPQASAQASDKAMTLERVVIVMRHGIKRPNSNPPLQVNLTGQTWPTWSVPPAWLTPHGEQAIARVADFDHHTYARLLGTACPPAGAIRILADTDQRTLKTAAVYADTAFKGCGLTIESAGQDKADDRFSPFDANVASPKLDMQAVAKEALPDGGLAAIDQANTSYYALLSDVLDLPHSPLCADNKICTLRDMPSGLETTGKDPKVTGALKISSSLAQILMLEYANGFPMTEVGWGKVSAKQIRELSALHAQEFSLISRPKAVSSYAASGLLQSVKSALFDANATTYTVLVGHDGNLAYIGGALGLHWQARGFAADDPPPGSGLIFELWRDATGRQIVKVRYRSQSLDGLRDLTPMIAADSQPLDLPLCGNTRACPAQAFADSLSPKP